MNIVIENCKNIKRAEMDIDEEKINILISASGAGKSTIKEALSYLENNELKSVYCNENPSAIINGDSVKDSEIQFVAFDESFKDMVLIEEEGGSNSSIYNIFIGDDQNYIEYLGLYEKHFLEMSQLRGKLDNFVNALDKIGKEVVKFTVKNEVNKASKLFKFEQAKDKLDKPQKRFLKNYSSNYYGWLKDGINYTKPITDKKCPFCKRKMSDAMIRRVEVIEAIPVNDFKILETSKQFIEDVNIKVPDFFKDSELRKLKSEIVQKNKIKNEIQKITNFMDDYKDITSINLKNPEILRPSKILYTEFPELEQKISDINEAFKDVRREYLKCKNRLNKVIRKNVSILNNHLDIFGIPYEFNIGLYESGEKKASYKLFHKSDLEKTHRVNGLSFGEKNIISLLLFIIKTESDYIIIDDPASSYDEYKRNSMYNMILKLMNNKTVLLLSHDSVFGKFFALDQKKNVRENKLGKLLFMENHNYYEEVSIKPIAYDDFGTLESHILNHLKNAEDLDYWSKIVLLRILFEPYKKRKNHETAYGYLSAILHRKSKNEMENKLAEKLSTEEQVLKNIKVLIGKMGINSFDLDKYNPNTSLKYDHVPFIDCMLLREEIKNKHEKRELSSVIHLNEAQLIQLNPFMFNFLSKSVYDLLNSHRRKKVA